MAEGESSLFRFGVFELDLQSGELRKDGTAIRLQPQPFKVLAALVSRAGQLVGREEIQRQLWDGKTFVDFERGVNFCIRQIRAALGDDAETPRYVETLPRRGYRFLAAVEAFDGASPAGAAGMAAPQATEGPPALAEIAASIPSPAGRRRVGAGWLPLAGAAAAALAALLVVNLGGWRSWFRPKSPAPPIRAIAVLPLQNLSGDPAQEYFSDGLTDALITDLAKIGSLRVISRTSVMRYKSTTKPTSQIARELRVDGFVEGSVVRSGDRVRVTAQLIDAASDQHLWAESYERDLRDIIALQGEVSQAISRQIQTKLTPQEQKRLAAARPVNPKAYDQNLLGWYHWHKSVPSDWKKAIAYFNQAIEIDPAYAAARSGLADSYLMLGLWGSLPAREVMPKGKTAAIKALEIDPSLAEAHFALAFAAMYYDWDWNLAEQEFRRGFELNPGYSLGRQWYASYLLFRGRYEESFAEQRRALELDPLSLIHQNRLGQLLYFARSYDQAIEQFRKSLEMDPNSYVAHYTLADAYKHKGMYQEAVAEYETAWNLYGEKNKAAGYRRAFAAGGFEGAKRWYADYLVRMENKPEGSPLMLAIAYAALGKNDLAFQSLEKAHQERRPYLLYLKLDPDFDPLRADPRFADLVRRIGLPPEEPAPSASPRAGRPANIGK